MRPIFLLYDEGVSQVERDAAISAIQEVRGIFQNRNLFVLGSKIKVEDFNLSLELLVQGAPVVRRTTYGDQIDAERIHSAIYESSLHKKEPFIGIVLVSKDLTVSIKGQNLNFCFGYTFGDVTVQSVARFRDMPLDDRLTMIKGVIQHELGHVFNLAGTMLRSNTEYNLGMHCTNPGCVMNQGLTRDALLRNFKLAKRMGRVYCPQCLEDAAEIEG